MDPQLQAVRAAAQQRFLAQKASAAPQAPQAAAAPSPPSGPSSTLPPHLAHLTPEQLNAPIGSLLSDAPPEYRAAKKPRVADPNAIVISKDRTAEIATALAQPAPTELRILTWNIDGLDEVGGGQALAQRMLSIARDIARHRPLAALLQEVIPPALELLSSDKVLGSAYEVVVPQNPPLPYYVAILLDKKRLRRLGEPQTLPFSSSQMGRQLLAVTVELVGVDAGPLLLATAHLESTKDHATERKRQLLHSLRHLRQAVCKTPRAVSAALLGGDLNIRDEEVKAVHKDLGDEAHGFADLWSFCGAPEAERWTWDTTQNSNVGANFACKTRFDRILFISPGVSDAPGVAGLAAAKAKAKAKASPHATHATATSSGEGWRPRSIRLLGKEKVAGLGRFPSDHWGLLTEWTCGSSAPASAPEKAAKPALGFANLNSSGAVIDLDA